MNAKICQRLSSAPYTTFCSFSALLQNHSVHPALTTFCCFLFSAAAPVLLLFLPLPQLTTSPSLPQLHLEELLQHSGRAHALHAASPGFDSWHLQAGPGEDSSPNLWTAAASWCRKYLARRNNIVGLGIAPLNQILQDSANVLIPGCFLLWEQKFLFLLHHYAVSSRAPFFALAYFSLDQLLVSTLDQQKLQSVLSSVTTKCDLPSLLREAKAQAEVSLHKIKMANIFNLLVEKVR